jgi:hypothetical protein
VLIVPGHEPEQPPGHRATKEVSAHVAP